MTAHGDSYCGIYCGACSVLNHGETGRGDGLVTCLANLPKAEIACGGCKSNSVYAGCRACRLRDCAVQKGIAHCVECTDYPCRTYKHRQSAARIVPHVVESSGSLGAIKENGTDAWIEAQRKRWSCPSCGAGFSWYAQECSDCGRSLGAQAYCIKGWRRLVLRLVLSIVFWKGKAKAQSA